MKKIFGLLFLVGLFVWSCTRTDVGVAEDLPLPKEPETFEVSVDEAKEAMNDLLGAMDGGTRSQTRTIDENEDVKYVYGKQAQTRSDGEKKPLFYVIEMEDEQGFALVSTDKRTTPVYAVIDEGSYDENTDNPGYKYFMTLAEDAYYQEIEAANEAMMSVEQDVETRMVPRQGGWSPRGCYNPATGEFDLPTPAAPPSLRWTVTGRVDPLLKTMWRQEDPYNNNCPTIGGKPTKAGCVPIAIAQVCAYWEYPNSFKGHQYFWGAINDNSIIPNDGLAAATSVANLVSDIGKHINVDYGVISSGAYTADAPSCFQAMGYSSPGVYKDYLFYDLWMSLDAKRPVILRGQDAVDGGHSWVADGYIRRTLGSLLNPSPTTQTLVHCNWGWEGILDGWFQSLVFDTSRRVNTRYNFAIGMAMVVNISR